ncbi:MAG: SDR family oxidoreductase [Byssovorax sp.]
MILVTGATGTVGSEVVEQLLSAGYPVRVLTRHPERAAKYASSVEIAQGDLASPETLTAAFAGVEKVFLLATGPELAKLEGHAIEAAKAAGVKHIVKLSAAGAELDPGIAIGRWHRESEKHLEESGLAWTILRPGAFNSNALTWAETIKAKGMVFHVTGNGKGTPIDPRDIAAVAVAALTTPGHEGKIYEMTGPEALTTAEMVAKISKALEKPIQCVDAPEAAARAGMLQRGMPLVLVEAVLELTALVREGYRAKPTPVVEEVLGRPARSFDTWLSEHIDAFR